ncbi:MAG: hypothetical protein LLG05_09840 [Porphyromonadaceae bacterium]|nr:hypothetical protein [Porphyromonadaceae bacterium]
MSDLSAFEYIQDKKMNDNEESYDCTDEEHEEAEKSPCRQCKRRGECHKCPVNY